jgi:hypothetical protein
VDHEAIIQLSHDLAEEFGLHLATVLWRQKKAFLSARRIGPNLTITFRADLDECEDEFIYALIYVLLCRITKQTTRPKYSYYQSYIKAHPPAFSVNANEQAPKVIRIRDPKGKVFNLTQIYEKVRDDYAQIFKGYFSNYPVKLGWSSRVSYRKMAFFHPTAQVIAVSPTLDTEEVPIYVLEYLLYHEMLHAFLGINKRNGKKYVHTPEFHALEKQFLMFDEANFFLKKFSTQLKRKHSR